MTQPIIPKPIQVRDGIRIGADTFVVIAGPCAVESREQLTSSARAVATAGAALLRGGAFKPRTSPDSFQGLGWPALELLAEASAATGLPVITEVMDPRDVERIAQCAAVLQIGSRSMQNFPLLREVGKAGLPVLLKRGNAATLDELISASEYVRREGNEAVMFCERGVRGFDPSTRNLLDLSAVPILQQRTGAPVIVDPSHGTGRADLVPALSRAALAVGADGLLVEVHHNPRSALSDGHQALTPPAFADMMIELARWVPLTGRRLLGISEASLARTERSHPVS